MIEMEDLDPDSLEIIVDMDPDSYTRLYNVHILYTYTRSLPLPIFHLLPSLLKFTIPTLI